MKVTTEIIEKKKEEQVIIRCYEVNRDVEEMISFIDSRSKTVEGYSDGKVYRIPIREIYYIESVDDNVYAYLERKVCELRIKLYEFEDLYGKDEFFRCSKNTVVNLMKIDFLKPALNGRFSARLYNLEDIIISRKYASVLRKRLK